MAVLYFLPAFQPLFGRLIPRLAALFNLVKSAHNLCGDSGDKGYRTESADALFH